MENRRQNFEITILKKTKIVSGDIVYVVDMWGEREVGKVVEITNVSNVLNPTMHKITGVVEFIPIVVVRDHDTKGNQL